MKASSAGMSAIRDSRFAVALRGSSFALRASRRQRCPGCHILVDLRLHDDPFYKLLYVMQKHRVIYRIFYVALYVMKIHRVIYRMR